jgi:hypothetical protein
MYALSRVALEMEQTKWAQQSAVWMYHTDMNKL